MTNHSAPLGAKPPPPLLWILQAPLLYSLIIYLFIWSKTRVIKTGHEMATCNYSVCDASVFDHRGTERSITAFWNDWWQNMRWNVIRVQTDLQLRRWTIRGALTSARSLSSCCYRDRARCGQRVCLLSGPRFPPAFCSSGSCFYRDDMIFVLLKKYKY